MRPIGSIFSHKGKLIVSNLMSFYHTIKQQEGREMIIESIEWGQIQPVDGLVCVF